MKRLSFIVALLAVILLACTPPERKVTPAFYHWKTEFSPTHFEQKQLDSLEVQKLYLKLFDVDVENGAFVPKAILYGKVLPFFFEKKEIVPTIFITNRTLKGISDEQLVDLVEKIYAKISYLTKKNSLPFQEIQLDCDWTLATKDAYFSLIAQLKSQFSKELKISATIRLHQIKFFEKTGVPPVDRGMLMYYNMGSLEDWNEPNSILNNKIGQQYLENAKNYPLGLDVALPIFAWGVLFRDGQMIRLMNNLTAHHLAGTERFEKIEENKFRATQNSYVNGYYLYKNDEIRLEGVQQEQLETAAELLAPVLNSPKFEVVFYHLDSLNLANFPAQQLKKIMDVFE